MATSDELRAKLEAAILDWLHIPASDPPPSFADALLPVVVEALAERYPDVVQVPPADLHAAQVEWKREQAESFGAYLARQGKTDDISREWPIQSPPADWSPEQLPAPREERAS